MSRQEAASGGALRAARALLVLAALAGTCAVAEGALRLLGDEPWRARAADLIVEPGGRLYRAHPTLGYVPIPGRFSVLFPTGHRFQTTHDERGQRITHAAHANAGGGAPAPGAAGANGVWLFGGSFTYGWAIDDRDSVGWQLQTMLPGARVENLAVPGYGTLHGLVQLEEAIETGRHPRVAVVCYASFHDVRNTFARERRKRVAPYNRLGPLVQPYARLDPSGLRLAMARVEYRPWPGMGRSALVHRAERAWNRFERARLREGEVTERILGRFAERSAAVGSAVLVATLTRDARAEAVRRFAAGLGVHTLDLGVDLDRPGFRNTPHDAHPSPRAAREYARRLESALSRLLVGLEPDAPPAR